MAEISIIVPIYNVAPWLETCCESLAAQTFRDLEILLIDDGSTDGSGEICDRWAAMDSRFAAVHQSNQGVSAARNRGMELAAGKYIGFADGDDWLEPDALEQLYTMMEQHSGAAMACAGYFEYLPGGGKPLARPNSDQVVHGFAERETAIRNIMVRHGYFTTVWNKLFRREFIGGERFDTGLHFGEDEKWLVSVLARSGGGFFAPKPIYHWRSRPTSITHQSEITPRLLSLMDAYDASIEIVRPISAELEHLTRSRKYNDTFFLQVLAYCAGKREILRRIRHAQRETWRRWLCSPYVLPLRKGKVMAVRLMMALHLPGRWVQRVFDIRRNQRERYKFSVVMAVYNVAPYLREAIRSVIAQDIGFRNIQLILVDDGSTDGSGGICDAYAAKYPNILALHQENRGVSAARNLGLDYAAGEYVNFLDGDDRLSGNALRRVYEFFGAHGEKTDLVSIPIWCFDGQKGPHSLNDKFGQGSRVIDLRQEWQTAQMHISSSFIRAACLEKLRFDTRLSFGEDAQLVQRVLLEKQTLGVVSDARYHYRIRSGGSPSAIQSCEGRKEWYLPCIRHLHREIFRQCMERFGSVPRYVQYTLLRDLQWRWKEEIPGGVLTGAEAEQYKTELFDLLRFVDDEVILAQKELPAAIKAALLRENTIGLSEYPCRLDFLQWKKSVCLEGRFFLPVSEKRTVAMEVSGKYPCEIRRVPRSLEILGETVANCYAFRAELPLGGDISFAYLLDGERIPVRHLEFGKYFPIGTVYRNSCFTRDGWCLTAAESGLRMMPAAGILSRELARMAEIWKTDALGGRKSLPVRLAYPVLKKLKRRPLWLISDRPNRAGDNGEALFRYLREHHPEIDARFVIWKDSPDFEKLRKIGPVLGFRSLRHRFLAPIADCILSSHGDEKLFNPFDGYGEPYRDLFADTNFVFLQHGITKDDFSGWLNRYDRNFSGFVTAAIPERNAIASGLYGYGPDQVWLTGFPRFDRLYRDEQRQVTIMPTWRRYLLDAVEGGWIVNQRFPDSDYVRFYSALLTSDRLISAARRLNYRIAFLPHPTVQHYLSHFRHHEDVEMLGPETDYRDVFAHSNLVVTDYSSAVFDFVYLRKPVVYAQFDREEFFSGAHVYRKGWFDYEKDGFGEVERDLNGTVDRIIEYMENSCCLKEKYRRRIDGFFAFHDRNNSRRVFEKIIDSLS